MSLGSASASGGLRGLAVAGGRGSKRSADDGVAPPAAGLGLLSSGDCNCGCGCGCDAPEGGAGRREPAAAASGGGGERKAASPDATIA